MSKLLKFYKLISFNNGDGIYEVQSIIDSDRITKMIKITINPIDEEYNKNNNNNKIFRRKAQLVMIVISLCLLFIL